MVCWDINHQWFAMIWCFSLCCGHGRESVSTGTRRNITYVVGKAALAGNNNRAFSEAQCARWTMMLFLVPFLKLNLIGGFNPSENMSSSVGMMTFPIYGESESKSIHVPNHQPVEVDWLLEMPFVGDLAVLPLHPTATRATWPCHRWPFCTAELAEL